MDCKKNKAFTLAEVLITLGVIGVVSAITMPSVIQKQQEKVTVNRLKSAYSILSQAFQRAITENGTPETWGMGAMNDPQSNIIMGNAFVPYLKLTKNCIGQSADYTSKNCSTTGIALTQYSHIVLANGTSVSFRTWTGNCDFGHVPDTCGEILVDINGMQKPNKVGKDKFQFYMTKTKLVPFGVKDATPSFKRNCDITNSNPINGFSQMSTCTAWVLYNENMDYLHCTDLDWDGKHSCKE